MVTPLNTSLQTDSTLLEVNTSANPDCTFEQQVNAHADEIIKNSRDKYLPCMRVTLIHDLLTTKWQLIEELRKLKNRRENPQQMKEAVASAKKKLDDMAITISQKDAQFKEEQRKTAQILSESINRLNQYEPTPSSLKEKRSSKNKLPNWSTAAVISAGVAGLGIGASYQLRQPPTSLFLEAERLVAKAKLGLELAQNNGKNIDAWKKHLQEATNALDTLAAKPQKKALTTGLSCGLALGGIVWLITQVLDSEPAY